MKKPPKLIHVTGGSGQLRVKFEPDNKRYRISRKLIDLHLIVLEHIILEVKGRKPKSILKVLLVNLHIPLWRGCTVPSSGLKAGSDREPALAPVRFMLWVDYT